MARYTRNEASTVPQINTELEKIEAAIEDSLSRKGDAPNSMSGPLDMNNQRILNIPAPVDSTDPLRKIDGEQYVTAAATSAAEALESEQNAAASATSAAASASSASSDASVAAGLIEDLNAIYLGAFITGPETDNEGNPLQQGALYYNTISKNLLVFNGISWVISASQESAAAAELSAVNAALSAAAALASEGAAQDAEDLAEQHKDSALASASSASSSASAASASQSAAATSATNAATSASQASSSASAASASASAAAVSETNASNSESAAATSESNAASSASAALSSEAEAATSEINAATSEANAAASATSAASSATAAAGSATSASNSAATALLYLNDTEAARDEVLQYSTAVSKGLVFIGLYDASTGVYPTLPVDIVGNPFWIISTGGTVSGVVLNPGDSLIYDVTNEVFIKLDTVDQVVSVAGKTGAVTLAIGDITGLQSALDAKVDDSQLDTAATADSVAQRTSDGSLNVVGLGATGDITLGAGGKIKFNDDRYFSPENNVDGAEISANGIFKVKTGATPTERFRIDASGNVGIGTSPSELLHIFKTSYPIFKIESTSYSGSLGIDTGNGNLVLANTSNAGLVFNTNSTERMRIDSSGDILHGGTAKLSPKALDRGIYIESSGNSSRAGLSFYTNDGNNNYRGVNYLDDATGSFGWDMTLSTGAMQYTWNYVGGELMRLTNSGNLGIGTSSPNSNTNQTTLTLNNGTWGGRLDLNQGANNFGSLQWTAHLYGGNGLDINGQDSIGFSVGNSRKVIIDSSGNVGIGTSSPASKIDIFNNSATDGNIRTGNTVRKYQFGLTGATSGEYLLYDITNSQSAYSYLNTNGHIFYTSSAERMRIDSSGRLLVGTTSGSFGSRITALSATSYTFESIRTGTGSEGQIAFVNGNGAVGSIFTNGSSTSYNTSSDYRLKEDWQPMDCACDRVMQLNPVNFAWKSSGERVDGFLAHELAEVIPEAVTGEKDETRIEEYEVEPAVYEDVVIPAEFDEEGNEVSPERTEQKLVKEAVMGEREVPVYQGIDQSKVVPLLTAALQHALKDIADLKARIEALEGEK